MKRIVRWSYRCLSSVALLCGLVSVLGIDSAQALNGGTVRVTTVNGWKAFEVISQADNPAGDGYTYAMPSTFDGAGAWQVNGSTLRVMVNHETSDASVSEVDLDLGNLQVAVTNMITNGNTGGVSFVLAARQAYGRWSSDGGATFTTTTSTSNTSFLRFCSGQSYAADTFGPDRGFVDPVYITGEEDTTSRLFVLDNVGRDFYQLSGTVGSAPGGTGGMPFDYYENAALIDTGETGHVALLLSPDGGTNTMKLYVGVKGRDKNGNASTSFLARNGLAYGSWYYLNATLPSLGATNGGTFDTTSSGALTSTKLEDVDTSPTDPTRVVLGDQDSGVFTFDFDLAFSGSFSPSLSSFAVTKISNTSGGSNSVDSPDNVDWTAATTLAGTSYADGLVFVNEDNSTGEIWRMRPDGSNQLRVGSTTVGAESTGIIDISGMVGYAPGSVLITNNQGSTSSMTVLINPDATSTSVVCGDLVCELGETPVSCPSDCPNVCGDSFCTGSESTASCPADCGSLCGDGACNGSEATTNCPADCGTQCGDGVCNGAETAQSCASDCAPQCIPDGGGLGCTATTQCCSGVGHCSTNAKVQNRVCVGLNCRPVGQTCSVKTDCCSNNCRRGTCR